MNFHGITCRYQTELVYLHLEKCKYSANVHFLRCTGRGANIWEGIKNGTTMDITLIEFMKEQLGLVSLDFKRYMYTKLPWEARLVGLMGPRGVGKSTMIMQHIAEMGESERSHALYVSADHSYFTNHSQMATFFPCGASACCIDGEIYWVCHADGSVEL
jgi:hypothetical protein